MTIFVLMIVSTYAEPSSLLAGLASSFSNRSDDQQIFFQQCEPRQGAFMSGLAVEITLPAV